MNSRSKICAASTLALCLAACLAASPAFADSRDEAKHMHDRLAGVPPTESTLTAMTALIDAGDPEGAAFLAIETPYFYGTTLKNFVTPWTNEARTVYAPLNDYTALVIGMVRDGVPFDQLLSADMAYVGAPGVVGTGYSQTNNTHFEMLESSGIDLSDPGQFIQRTQSGLPGAQIGSGDAAGVITTRAAGEAFFTAGTNRAMFRFTAINHLCRDMEELNDITLSADWIRQDVTRSPGGDSRIFHNTCVGCHTGMDPFSGAFAYFDFDVDLGRTVFTRGSVQPKNLNNSNVFAGGYVTVDDTWRNMWRVGQNAALGWDPNGPVIGNGPQSFGQQLATTRAFAQCKVVQVLEHVCLRPPSSVADQAAVESIATTFETQGYDMKRVFAEVAAHCRAD